MTVQATTALSEFKSTRDSRRALLLAEYREFVQALAQDTSQQAERAERQSEPERLEAQAGTGEPEPPCIRPARSMNETHPINVAEGKKRHNIADYAVPFRKGFDPRRRPGSPSLGRQITAYMNELGREDADGNAVYAESDLKAIIKSPKSSHAKVIAAQDLLRAREDGYDKIGRIPKAADSINRIMDRTEGKAKVVMQIEHKQPSADDLYTQLLAYLGRHPALLDQPAISVSILVQARKSNYFRKHLVPILAEHHPKLLEALDADVIEPPKIELEDSGGDQTR